MRKLQLGFRTEENKKKDLTFSYFDADLSEEVIKDAMQKIVDSKAFKRDSTLLYDKIEDAAYIENNREDIFTINKPTA